ncbi:MAG: dienelactone hydrolase family protein [Phenylobacterium sp.]|uniref:dienelactone hydrolase family protein n=1 Tax=Phenylobacterium sp. TaxID=1871053 RepID=UPI00179C65BB|nr:dienelactone hydrolase family protein [Phenylobacterium sp.]MBA4793220.1 dienelactone hydrolase family protein [Phenylobacterium sp.]
MTTLTRPEGTMPSDLNLSRRKLGAAVLGGYAVFALSAQAEPIATPETGLVTETVQLSPPDTQIPANLARPQGAGPFPVVVVVSEIFGVHEYIRDVCRRLAQLGYVAIAPDFFARAGDPSKLTDYAEIRKIVATATDDQVMGDLAAAMAFLQAQDYADADRAAITGFCWGGNIVWQAAQKTDFFDAGVAWYGRLAPPADAAPSERQWPVDLAAKTSAPVLGLYAGQDQGIPLSDVEKKRAALKAAGKTDSDIVVYPDAQHGFHADYRSAYDAEAAKDGWRRMLAHFAQHGVAPAKA